MSNPHEQVADDTLVAFVVARDTLKLGGLDEDIFRKLHALVQAVSRQDAGKFWFTAAGLHLAMCAAAVRPGPT